MVHLAWNKRDELGRGLDDSDVETIDPFNLPMGLNIYHGAIEVGLKRVVMASSVCADDFPNFSGPGLMRTDQTATPFKPYGASKLWIEATGRYFVEYHNLEVVCIRFGAVRRNNLPPKGEGYIWLSSRDCVSAIRAVLVAEEVPSGYACFYAVSDNQGRIHDLTNPFGWEPEGRV